MYGTTNGTAPHRTAPHREHGTAHHAAHDTKKGIACGTADSTDGTRHTAHGMAMAHGTAMAHGRAAHRAQLTQPHGTAQEACMVHALYSNTCYRAQGHTTAHQTAHSIFTA